MTKTRQIRKVFRSKPTIEGAGVHLKRAFGNAEVELFDPFLLLDDFRSDNPALYLKGFPWHPHRGIETITYVLEGDVEHGDSLGHKGIIGPGDVQWMTAGSGIIHQEMPKGDLQGRMYGFQLWANLPASHKMMGPRYRDVRSDDIPVVTSSNGAMVRVICGTYDGTQGPVRDIVTDPEYFDVTVPPNSQFTHSTSRGHTVIAYVIGGKGEFCHENNPFGYEVEGANYFDNPVDRLIGNTSLILFGDGDAVTVTTDEEPVRFLLVSGKPIGEPIAWYGPIVMNTREELKIAYEELEQGTFIKHQQR
ncbi:MAG: pirin family protein [Armatimonadota bacterium]